MHQMNLYTKANGEQGCGFLIQHAGRQQHSVAWPSGPALRYMSDELDDLQITVSAAFSDVPAEEEKTPVGESTLPAVDEVPEFQFDAEAAEAVNIRAYLTANPAASNQDVIRALHECGMEVSSSQVSGNRKALEKLASNADEE